MRRLTLRSLWQHKRRLMSTILAVLLGVAFMAGSFVFTDTLDHVFDDLFATVNENADAEVRGETLFDSDFGEQRGRLDDSIIDKVEQVDGVRALAPYVESFGGRVLGRDGEPVGAAQGPPTIFQPWTADRDLNPYRLTEGRAPGNSQEITLNLAAAEDGGHSVGDRVTVISQFGPKRYRLVGVFRFGSAESAAGSVSAVFTLAEAQRLAGAEGQLDSVSVAAEEGMSEAAIVDRLRPVLPAGAEVVTAAQATEEQADEIQEGLSFFRIILTTFAAIALLTGSFIIYNTFAILVAQRTRELALLRALGAGRSQVLGSVLLEAVVVGLVASALGLLTGIGLAAGIQALMRGFGIDVPSAGLVVRLPTVVTAISVGVIVTFVAAIAPALRATRVPPIAALREVSLDRSGTSRWRAATGALLLLVAAFGLAQAFAGTETGDSLPAVGLGSLAVFLAAVVLGPVIAGPAALALGGPLRRLKGVTGVLARQNAARNPKRTASTAAALMISVALIGIINVFAASARQSIEGQVNRGLKADLILQTSTFDPTAGVSPALAVDLADLDGVAAVSELRTGPAQLTLAGGKKISTFISAIDPATIDSVLDLKMTEGDMADLAERDVAVNKGVAEDEGLSVGDRLELLAPGGKRLTLRVGALSDEPQLVGDWAITNAAYASVFPELLDAAIFINVADGADLEAVRAAVERMAEIYPTVDVLDLEEFVGDLANQINSLLTVVYGLLGLSVVIAIIGVGNTLSLSIHERTRELGLLRAVGMTRQQLRSTVRWESVIMALLGTALGLGLSLLIGFAMVKALENEGLTEFVVPVGSMATVVVLAAVLGVVASVRPARRAAKMDVLAAISTE